MLKLTLEDIEKGLVDIKLETFSPKEVQIYKTYQSNIKASGYSKAFAKGCSGGI